MLSALLLAAVSQGTQTIPIYVISYFPTTRDAEGREVMDKSKTGDVTGLYGELKKRTESLTTEAMQSLEEGSKFRGYKLPSPPAIRYRVVGQVEYKEAMPLKRKRADEKEPVVDYGSIMERVGAEKLVKEKGVKEFWIWGYHGGVLTLWESNMSSPYGDISNSDRNELDLPTYDRTYTVYHYNYGRGLGEMLENHMHQLEHLLNHVDGRDTTPPEKWNELLFWGKFVGSDASHKIVTTPARCGWTHYAPNSERDYDWANPRSVETDIEDWHPDRIGKTQMMNADRWGRDAIRWRIYWMQAIPGLGHDLSYKGRKLRNWWEFKVDWDRAKRQKLTLIH